MTIRVQSEAETGRGWSFEVLIERDADEVVRPGSPLETSHRVTLSWADYEYWSHGSASPASVVRRVVEFLLDQHGFDIPARFDAATARRWFPAIDRALDGDE